MEILVQQILKLELLLKRYEVLKFQGLNCKRIDVGVFCTSK
jgi:hypothetical protein